MFFTSRYQISQAGSEPLAFQILVHGNGGLMCRSLKYVEDLLGAKLGVAVTRVPYAGNVREVSGSAKGHVSRRMCGRLGCALIQSSILRLLTTVRETLHRRAEERE